MNIFQRFFAFLRYREAVRLAENAHDKSGQRFYVLPSLADNCHLIIVDRKNFRTLKQKHYINQNANSNDLVRECFYCTADRAGNGFLLPADRDKKYLSYLSWCDARRKLRRLRKRVKSNKR